MNHSQIGKNIKLICKHIVKYKTYECNCMWGDGKYSLSLPPKHWWSREIREYIIDDDIVRRMINVCKLMGYTLTVETNHRFGYHFTVVRDIYH